MSRDSVRQEDIPAGAAADPPVWGPPREPDCDPVTGVCAPGLLPG